MIFFDPGLAGPKVIEQAALEIISVLLEGG